MRQATRIAAPICRYISGCVAQPSPATAQFPVPSSVSVSAHSPIQSSSAQSLSVPASTSLTKVVQVPRGFARVPRCTRYSHSQSQSPLFLLLLVSVCTGTCVRAASSSSSTWPAATSPSRLTWSPRPHIAYWISCLPLLRRRRRPGSGNILC